MKLKLIERKPEVPGVESFVFAPAEPIVWKAGQYLHYVLHHEPTDDRGSDRWFTIASSPYEKNPMITTRFNEERSSSFKKALKALKIGDEIEVSEVEGDFTLEDLGAEYVFLAGGIGITPFHSIIKELAHEGTMPRIALLYANRDEHIPYRSELDAIAQSNPNLTIHYLAADERLDEGTIKKYVPDPGKPIFCVSGPEPMVESLGTVLKSIGVQADHLKQDWFPGYPAEN